MSAGAATELLFLPGFDGEGNLRAAFVSALSERFPARAVTYPNRRLETLNGYCRHAAAGIAEGARPVLVAESFSGLVAARWAARDPHVAGLVLCGAFARNPAELLAPLAAMLPEAIQLGTRLFGPMALATPSAERRQWSRGLGEALRSLDPAVISERLALIAREDVRAELASLRVPVVLLQFADDLVIGPRARRELERSCAGARVIGIDGPHFALETMPRACAEAILGQVTPLFGSGA